jgi:hypothetical protein
MDEMAARHDSIFMQNAAGTLCDIRESVLHLESLERMAFMPFVGKAEPLPDPRLERYGNA